MKECRRNIELFYLLGKLAPDFRTIADFRKDNATALKNTFKAFSKLCLKLDLFEKELLAVDGTKIHAVNSKDNCYNESVLKKKLSNIEEKIENYLSSLETSDNSSSDDMELSEGKISDEYSCAVTPQIRQMGNRLSGLAETAYASLLA